MKGVSITDPCPDCRGRGRVARTRTITVSIPAGIDDNSSLRLTGQGEASPDGGLAGNAYVRIIVAPHPLFTRKDRTIFQQVRVNVAQAALGDELEVETIDGPVAFRLPEGTQSGQQFRLKGRGAPSVGGTDRGDQIVTVQVVTPKKLTPEQRELFEQLAASLDSEAPRSRRRADIFLPGEGRLAVLAVSRTPVSHYADRRTAPRGAFVGITAGRRGLAGILPRRRQTPSPRQRAGRICIFPLAGGEMVSQGSLEPLFQVRILARQPRPRQFVPPLADRARESRRAPWRISPRQDERVGLVVLAAGAGTRMRSLTPEAAAYRRRHPHGRARAARRRRRAARCPRPRRRPEPPISPVGLTIRGDIVTVVQDPPRGTGDAVRLALTALPDVDRLVVLYCDHPLLEPSTVAKLLAGLRASGAKVTI